MRTIYCFVALALVAAAPGITSAQITFDQNYFLSQVGITRDQTFHDRSDLETSPLSAAELAVITDIVENRIGADQTYDFSSVAYDLRGSQELTFLTSADGLPGASEPAFSSTNFISANNFVGFGAFYIYYEMYADSLVKLGTYAETSFGDQLITYSPPLLEFALPLTDGTMWSSEAISSIGNTPISETGEVEGYGTLILPGDIQADALRIKRTSGGTIFSSTIYEFWTLEGHVAMIEYERDFFGNETLSNISYTASSATGTSTESADELPAQIALGQNYPNPFNPSTVIPFEVASAGPVSLRVYDTLGREVGIVFEGTLAAGRHEMAWSAEDVPSGVYYYRLEGAGESVTRSLQLLR